MRGATHVEARTTTTCCRWRARVWFSRSTDTDPGRYVVRAVRRPDNHRRNQAVLPGPLLDGAASSSDPGAAAQVEGAREELTQEMGREPRDVDVARRIGTDATSVRSCTEAVRGFRADSLDAPGFNGGPCLGDVLASTFGDPENCLDRVVLRRAMATLTSRERRVLSWRFCDDLTQAEIGELLGVSQMQVSRILRAALARLRSMLIPDEEPEAA
nr:sigma-70 family RNA polymerase sigma factor [Tessaracoccus coleopterorum]